MTLPTAAEKTYVSFEGIGNEPPLPHLCRELIRRQILEWDTFSRNFASLKKAQTRKICGNGYAITLQWNPARVISTTAPVDQDSIRRRPCFLCVENLPRDQKGILYRRHYLILCNPYPVFAGHLTLSHVIHTPQILEGKYETLLMAAKDFHPAYDVIYNGPECGASAPDHLHFQAIPRSVLPIFRDVHLITSRTRKTLTPSVSHTVLRNLDRSIIMMEGNDAPLLSTTLHRIIQTMKDMAGVPGEPMCNLLCSFTGSIWQVLLFLRRKHRPEVYFLTGDEQVLISPGALDMAGFVITPRQRDYERIDALLMQQIYREISLDTETVNELVSRVFP